MKSTTYDQSVPVGDDATWVAIWTSAWFLTAMVAGAAGLLEAWPFPFPQLVLVAVTLALVVTLSRSTVVRRWAMTVDLRILVLLHAARFVGIYFLFLASRGELAPEFALPAGWGDIVVALLAVLLVLFVPFGARAGRGALLAWNIIGLVDILYVIAVAVWVGATNPFGLRAFLWLPLALLPMFLVPLIVVTHLVIFARLLGYRGAPSVPLSDRAGVSAPRR